MLRNNTLDTLLREMENHTEEATVYCLLFATKQWIHSKNIKFPESSVNAILKGSSILPSTMDQRSVATFLCDFTVREDVHKAVDKLSYECTRVILAYKGLVGSCKEDRVIIPRTLCNTLKIMNILRKIEWSKGPSNREASIEDMSDLKDLLLKADEGREQGSGEVIVTDYFGETRINQHNSEEFTEGPTPMGEDSTPQEIELQESSSREVCQNLFENADVYQEVLTSESPRPFQLGEFNHYSIAAPAYPARLNTDDYTTGNKITGVNIADGTHNEAHRNSPRKRPRIFGEDAEDSTAVRVCRKSMRKKHPVEYFDSVMATQQGASMVNTRKRCPVKTSIDLVAGLPFEGSVHDSMIRAINSKRTNKKKLKRMIKVKNSLSNGIRKKALCLEKLKEEIHGDGNRWNSTRNFIDDMIDFALHVVFHHRHTIY